MALEPLEQVVIGVGLAVGMAGTIWQVYRYYHEKRESTTERLATRVLYPWSKVELIPKYTRSESPLMKTLHVPAEALPEKEAALTKHPYGSGAGWLELEELSGLSQARGFLQTTYPEVRKDWRSIENQLSEYHELRSRIVEGVPIFIEQEMQRLHPELEQAPEGTHDPETGTYVLALMAGSVVRDAYYIALYQDERKATRLSLGSTQQDDVVTYVVRADTPLFRVADEDQVDLEEMQASYESWVQQAGLRTMASDFVMKEKELEKALEGFRKRLQDVIDEIEYERRPRRRRRRPAGD